MKGVLLVDDDRELVTSLAAEVERLGFKGYVAASADEAVELLLNNEIDVMVTDLRMGKRDGIDLIRMTKQTSPRTRPILMSAYATARDYKVAVDLGAVDVLPKPFGPDDLAQSIQKALDCEDGLRGTVHGISLTDILQMFHFAKRTLTVQLGSESLLHMKDGEVIHAETSGQKGIEALKILLTSRSGAMRTIPLASEEKSIDIPFKGLLLDVMREIDEAKHIADSLASGKGDKDVVNDTRSAESEDSGSTQGPTTLRTESLQSVSQRSGQQSTPRQSTPAASLKPPASGDLHFGPSVHDLPALGSHKKRSDRNKILIVGGIAVGAIIVLLFAWFVVGRQDVEDTSTQADIAASEPNSSKQVDPKEEKAEAIPAQKNGDGNTGSKPSNDKKSAANMKQDEATANRRVTVVTKPAGLQIVDAKTGEEFGTAPVSIAVASGAELMLRAKKGRELSDSLAVPAGTEHVVFDLVQWTQNLDEDTRAPSRNRRTVRRWRRRSTPTRTTSKRAAAGTDTDSSNVVAKNSDSNGGESSAASNKTRPMVAPLDAPRRPAVAPLEGAAARPSVGVMR